MKLWMCAGLAAAPMVFLFAYGCSSSSNGGVPQLDAGGQPDTATGDGGKMPDTGGGDSMPNEAGCNVLCNAPPPPPLNAVPNGQLLLTASGESLALAGYNFPAQNMGDPVFADGWEVRFTHYIATFDKVSLWNNPDTSTTDQSMVGSLVAELDGPWAVDMHQNAAGYPYIPGKEQGEIAVAFAVLANQNKNGNMPFPTDGTRLAVGFSTLVATPNALNVNLGPEGLAAYQTMIQNGCVTLYQGTATWKGGGGVSAGNLCVAPGSSGDAGGGGVGGDMEFLNIPQVVNFDICFKPRTALAAGTIETSYINCDNQDNDPAPPLNMEPHERGIAFKANTYTVGEVTYHTDHPFWESTKHDTPARFDQFAAQVVAAADAGAADGGAPTVHLEDTAGVDYTAFTDKQGNVLPWRTCDPNYANPNGGGRIGQMHFDPVAVPHCTNNDSATGFCDYRDFSKYNQSTQGHWNGADGLCFVKRNYPSPP